MKLQTASSAKGCARASAWVSVPRGVGAGLLVLASVVIANGANNSVSGVKKDEFQTAAPYAILLDSDNGTVLFEKAADKPTAPSSLAKLMTAELVFNEIVQGRLKPDDEFLISEDAWRRGGAPSHTSSMFAPIHSRVKVSNLLQGLIIQSANDAAIALAQGISGNETAFAIQMNARAKELGLTRSNFTNATGLPDRGMQASVRDLAKLARHTIRTYPQFYSMYGEREFTWNNIRQQNRNPLLAMNINADGMKTGFTSDGGYGLVGSAIQNNWRLIVVVNGLKSDKERGDEAKKLLEWGYRTFEPKLLFAEGQTVGDAKIFGGASGSVSLVGDGPINLMVPRNSNERIIARIVYSGPLRAPVEQGAVVAKLRVSRGDIVALEVPLRAAEAVPRGGVTGRAFDAASELVIGLFRRSSTR
jgi:serine-type D-Ala-D-Ala carboxypeptidase (penicillin-binding protein 5/6)